MSTTEESRRRVGQAVRHERSRRGWSVETAVTEGGIGHMTWRRIERGETVQSRSYRGVDAAFGWQIGHTLSVVESDEADEVDLLPAPTADTSASAASERLPRRSNMQNLWRERNHAVHGGGSMLSQEFEQSVSLLEYLNIPELTVLRDHVDSALEQRQDMVDTLKRILDELPDHRPYYWHYGRESSHRVADDYTRAYQDYSQTWNSVAQDAARAYEITQMHLGTAERIQEVYTTMTVMQKTLGAATRRLDEAEARARAEHENMNEPESTPERIQ